MNQKYIIGLLSVFIVTLTVLGLIKDNIFKKQLNQIQRNMAIQEQGLTEMVLLHSKLTSPVKFPENMMVFDEEGKKIKLSEIVQSRQLLVYKISKNYCPICVENELLALSKWFKNRQGKNPLLLTEGYIPKELKILKQRLKINWSTYMFESSLFLRSLSIEKIKKPYFFVLDSSLNATLFFVPDERFPNLSDAYYEQISGLLVTK